MIKRFNLYSLCAVLALLLIGVPAQAQEREEDNVTVIEVNEDGTVTIDGKVVEADGNAIDVEGEVVVRVKDADGETLRVYRSGNDLPSVFTRFRGLDDDDRRIDFDDLIIDRDMDAQLQFRRGAELNDLFRGRNAVRWGDGDIGSRYRVFSSDDDGAISVFGSRLDGPAREAEQERLKARMEIMKREREAMEMAQKIRRTSGAEREELETELNAQLDTIFEMKMDMRQAQIDLLENRLAEERKAFEQRTTERKRMIERRKRELLGERDALDW
ncbi:MAG: hypothetical protein AAF730_13550 [Bacteroidota bacterium]